MADLNQVLEALRNADASGNIEDAKKLAVIANKLKMSKPEAPQQERLGTIPFINKAIAGTLGAPVDVIAGGLSLIPGIDIKEPIGGRKSIEKLMKSTGIVLPEEGRKPETIAEYAGVGIGEVVGLAIPSGGAIKLLSKGKGLVGQIASTIYKSMVKHPAITIASEITGGAGAGTGRGAGEQLFPESPALRSGAEIVGGVAGSFVPTALVHSPSAIALRTGKSLIKKISLPFTEEGAKYRAGEFLKSEVADAEKVITKIGEETISELPPVVKAGEKRLTTLYKSLIEKDPVTESENIETISKAIIKLEQSMRKIGYGSPEVLADITQNRISAIELRIDKRVMEAMGKAQKKLAELPVAKRKVYESRIVRNEIESVMRTELDNASKLWKEVPKEMTVGIDKTRKTFADLLGGLANSQKSDIPAFLKKDPIIANNEITATTIKEMQGLRSKLLEVSRIARKNGQWNKARIAGDVADAIIEDISIVAGEATTPGAMSLKVALAATKKNKERFERGIVGKILGLSKTGAPSIDPDLTLDISIGRMGQKGSIDINKVAITPDAVAATERYLTRSYVDYSVDKATGAIKPLKAEDWMKSNEAILDNFPKLRNQLTDASDAQKLADRTRVIMDARKKAIQNPKISEASRFLKSSDLNIEIEAIFKSNNPSRSTAQLVRQTRKDNTGNSIQGLKAGFVDYLLEKSAVGAFNEVGEQTLSGRTLLNLTKKNSGALSQVFSPDEISRINKIGNELAKIEMFERVRGGKVEVEMKDIATSALKLFSRVGGAQVGRWVAGVTGGGTVQTPGIFSEKFKAFASFLSKDRAFQMIHDAILSKDPALLKSLLLPINKPGSKIENLFILNKNMNLWLAGTGQRVIKDIEKEMKQ